VVIFFTCLDLEQKFSVMDGHLVVSAVFMGVHTWLSRKAADCKNESFPVGNYSISQLLISLFLSSPSGTPSAPYFFKITLLAPILGDYPGLRLLNKCLQTLFGIRIHAVIEFI